MPQKPSTLEKIQSINPGPETVYCTLKRRLLAILYDSVILVGILIVASAIALPFGNMNKTALHDFWFTLWLVLACFAYLGSCWRFGGLTVGMRAWRVKLVSVDGQNISWPRCLLRFLVGLISLAAFGLGILWALVDKENRCWHDLAARTILIKP